MRLPRRGSAAFRFALLLGAALILAQTATAAEPANLLRDFDRAGGVITTPHGCIFIDLFLAAGPQQQARGLMFVRHLDEFEGMTFGYNPPMPISMWMKNTYVPLDMIFFGPDGRVAGIAADTKPMSEDTIASPGPASIVLEVNAGFAARHRITRGDRLTILR